MIPPQQPSGQPTWTIDEACKYFTESGLPIKPERLRMIIRGLEWEPVGERPPPPGSRGGRREKLYPMGDMMILHARLAEFLVERGIRRRRANPPQGDESTG